MKVTRECEFVPIIVRIESLIEAKEILNALIAGNNAFEKTRMKPFSSTINTAEALALILSSEDITV